MYNLISYSQIFIDLNWSSILIQVKATFSLTRVQLFFLSWKRIETVINIIFHTTAPFLFCLTTWTFSISAFMLRVFLLWDHFHCSYFFRMIFFSLPHTAAFVRQAVAVIFFSWWQTEGKKISWEIVSLSKPVKILWWKEWPNRRKILGPEYIFCSWECAQYNLDGCSKSKGMGILFTFFSETSNESVGGF